MTLDLYGEFIKVFDQRNGFGGGDVVCVTSCWRGCCLGLLGL